MSIEIKRKSVDDIPNLNEPGVAENVDPLSQQIGNGSANDKGMNNELDSPVKDCESNK